MRLGQQHADFATTRIQPSGRQSKNARPFSVWQRLVEQTRIDKGLSLDVLSTKSKIGSKAKLWGWINHKEGYPPARSYTPEVNAALAKALALPAPQLAKAYEDSRVHFVVAAASVSRAPKSSITSAIKAIRSNGRQRWTTEQVVDVLRGLESA